MKIPEVKEAMDELSVLSMDKATRAEYEARIKELNDFYAGKTTSYKEGVEKGREEGKAEGAREKALETAKNALTLGHNAEQAAKIPDLSVEEVKRLQ